MQLSISNIAWPASADGAVLDRLADLGVTAIEVAPTMIWPSPTEVTAAEARRYRAELAGRGIGVVAAQSLLFGRPDLTVFGDEATRGRTLAYLGSIIRLCAELGAESLVFGSLNNRRAGDRDPAEIESIGDRFFDALAGEAERLGTVVVVEPLPRAYGADYLTGVAEAAELVRRLGRPGLRLHLDTACMSLAGEDIEAVLRDHAGLVHHVHISEPDLGPVRPATLDHTRFAEALGRSGYDRWLSIEMRPMEPFTVRGIEEAIAWARSVYFAAQGDG